jgi:hypothetical protein
MRAVPPGIGACDLEQRLMISNPEQSRGLVGAWDRFTAPTERFRRPFRVWRRARPFYSGLSILLSGLEIYWAPHSSVGKLLSMGLPGVSSVFIAIFLIIFGITVWFFPAYRVFSGIASILLALLSLIATNLGGFILGFLLGMLGGAFAVAWTPRADYTAETRRQRRKRLAEGGAAEAVAAGTATAEPETAAAAEAPTAVQPGLDPEHVENTQIIEQAARPDGPEPPAGTSTEEE